VLRLTESGFYVLPEILVVMTNTCLYTENRVYYKALQGCIMAMNIGWYDEQHKVIINRMQEGWTWDELRDQLKTVNDLAASVNGNIVFIIDISRAMSLPPGNTMVNGQYMIRQIPENVSDVIVIIESALIKTFMTMVFGLIPTWRSRTHFVKSLDDGQRMVDRLLKQSAA